MTMTIAITRNTPRRFDGYFASCMVEITPGVYVAPRMKKAVRDRIWKTVLDWGELLSSEAGVVLFWKSHSAPSGLGIRLLGWPKKELVDHEGTWLAVRNLTEAHDHELLEQLAELEEPSIDLDDPAGEHFGSLAVADDEMNSD